MILDLVHLLLVDAQYRTPLSDVVLRDLEHLIFDFVKVTPSSGKHLLIYPRRIEQFRGLDFLLHLYRCLGLPLLVID